MRIFDPVKNLWRRSSLRTQLVTITATLLLLALLVTAFVSASLYRQELVNNIDEDLSANAQNVTDFLWQSRTGAEDLGMEDYRTVIRFYGWMLDADGDPLVQQGIHTTSEDADTPQLPDLTYSEALEIAGEAFNVPGTSPTSEGFRMQVHVLPSQQEILLIGLPLDSVATQVERATFLIISIGLLATLGASMVAYSLVTRAFRPLLRVEKTAAIIAKGDLTQRVQTQAPADTEIGRLSISLNAMLERIEKAFEAQVASEQKMRRFIQDASHELRTPLVTIRGFSELYRQGGLDGNPEAVTSAMGRIESEATRLGQLVEDMLTLARLDEQRPLQMAPLDLNIIAHEAVMDMTVTAPDREVGVIGLDGGNPTSAPVFGDEGRIRQIVTNLVTNALRYTPAGSPLEIAVGTDSLIEGKPESVIEIRDHGEGINASDTQKIFERFYRADNSRHRETGGTGLGLAICAAIAAQHGGSVTHAETEGGGATMRLRLPKGDDIRDDEDHETVDEDDDL